MNCQVLSYLRYAAEFKHTLQFYSNKYAASYYSLPKPVFFFSRDSDAIILVI